MSPLELTILAYEDAMRDESTNSDQLQWVPNPFVVGTVPVNF